MFPIPWVLEWGEHRPEEKAAASSLILSIHHKISSMPDLQSYPRVWPACLPLKLENKPYNTVWDSPLKEQNSMLTTIAPSHLDCKSHLCLCTTWPSTENLKQGFCSCLCQKAWMRLMKPVSQAWYYHLYFSVWERFASKFNHSCSRQNVVILGLL